MASNKESSSKQSAGISHPFCWRAIFNRTIAGGLIPIWSIHSGCSKNVFTSLSTLNITPKHISLYEQAFTHPSYNADANTKHHDYERLEFLGDSVIDLIVAEISFVARPELNQGNLTKMRAALVSTNGLSMLARKYRLHEYIRLGNSFTGDISKANHILENVFEAFIGALYLDQGFVNTKNILVNLFINKVKTFEAEALTDYKSKLQEEVQAEHRESVSYELVKETGPAHEKHFVVRVCFDGIELGRGEGSTKKQAEQMAAKAALEKESK